MQGSSPRVLIVDDYFIARQVVANVMRDLNITDVAVASDGQAGWTAIEEAHKEGKPFDVVFLDRNMPVVEGIDVLKHFRALPEHAETAFIMISAATESREVLETIKAGADAFIGKPVSAETVAKKFQDVLDGLAKRKAGQQPQG